MTLNAAEVEGLLAFTARYYRAWSQVTQTPRVWYFDSDDLPDYRSANCALHLRVADASESDAAHVISHTVTEIIGHFRARGLPVVVDVDPVAEAQGWGRELRRRGVTPVVGSTLLMRYTGSGANTVPESADASEHLSIRRVPNDLDDPDTQNWIALAGMEEEAEGNHDDAAFWRAVALREARSPDCRLYLATWDGQAAGACQWSAASGWAYIDSVTSHPDFRRRGIATRLVAQAAQDALAQGNMTLTLFTDRGGAGEQVYRRLGFETWGVDVLRRHILW